MRSVFPLALLASFVALPLAGCGSGTPEVDRSALRADWQAWKTDRDSLYASPEGPVAEALRDSFPGLFYFAYDSTLAVAASLQPALQTDTLFLGTSTGELRPVVASGVLAFRGPDGRPHRLTAYLPLGLPPGEAELFVPFRDQTTGRETYGGGRYMDVAPGEDGVVALDFNRAYHPTCVVDPSFSCPLPPPENSLEMVVSAGERYLED
jgi:uncharacterized protein (DUF1684 family)